MNLFDIFLALPLLACVGVLFKNDAFLSSLLKIAIALGVLWAALTFIDFPQRWCDGSFLYPRLMRALAWVRGVL